MSELLINVSLLLPGDTHPLVLSDLLAPVIRAAVAVGGLTTNLSVQPYTASSVAEPASQGSAHVHTDEDASPLARAPVSSCASVGGAQDGRGGR